MIAATTKPYGLSLDLARRVWNALDDVSEPATAATVAAQMGAPLPSIRRALRELELCGFVRSYDGRTWAEKPHPKRPGRAANPMFLPYVRP